MKTITRGLVLYTKDRQRLTAVFCYKPEDPYAVWLSFPGAGPNRETVIYRFARDLLAEGLDQAAGDGDVLVEPHEVPGWQAITLRPVPGSELVLYIEAGPVEAFVAEIYRLIPMGREREFVDVDRAVDRALAKIFREVTL